MVNASRDQSMEPRESRAVSHCAVHGAKSMSRRVRSLPHKPLRVVDPLVILVFPLPDEVHESLTPELDAGLPLLLPKHLFHHDLRRNPGMVASWNPEGV